MHYGIMERLMHSVLLCGDWYCSFLLHSILVHSTPFNMEPFLSIRLISVVFNLCLAIQYPILGVTSCTATLVLLNLLLTTQFLPTRKSSCDVDLVPTRIRDRCHYILTDKLYYPSRSHDKHHIPNRNRGALWEIKLCECIQSRFRVISKRR
ncbi:hypothetical protein JOM56_002757 [Amanita muscaria]